MRKSLVFLTVFLTCAIFAQEEIKKDREPVFVLPDVVISGDADLKVGVEKKDLLPANYPLPPKETPLMEMKFIKGPYLEGDKRTPEFEKTEGKDRFGELTARLGSYDNYFVKMIYGRQIDKLGFLLNIAGLRKSLLLQDSGYSELNFSGDLTYALDKTQQLGLTLDYENEFRKTPYAAALGFDSLTKDFYTVYLRSTSVLSDKLNLNSSFSYVRSEVSAFALKNDEIDLSAKISCELPIENKKHLPGLVFDLKNDSIYGWTYTLALEDRVKIDNADIFVSLKSNNGWLFLNAKAVFDIDGFTRAYVSYEPGRNYPRFKELYSGEVYLLNPALRAENTWFYIITGVEHKLLKEVPLTLEFYRKEQADMLSYESTGNSTAPVNIGKASVLGINAKEEWKILEGLTQKLSYKYVNAVNPDNSAANITYTPVHTLSLGGEYIYSDWAFNAEFVYRGQMYYSQTLPATLSDALVISAGIKKSFGENISVFLNGENLLSREYSNIKDYPLAKAALNLGLTVKF